MTTLAPRIEIHVTPKQEPAPAPVTNPKYFVLWDWQCSRFAGGVRDMGDIKKPDGTTVQLHAVPCVFRLGDIEYIDGHYTYLNKEWQFFTFDLMCLSYYGKVHTALSDVEYNWIAKRWANVYDSGTFITNRQGTDVNRDYVNDTNKDATKGIGIYTLVCGGASLSGMQVTNIKGTRMLQVDTFDGTKPPPPIYIDMPDGTTKLNIDIKTDPRIFFATIISDKRQNGGYPVYRFSQLENPVTGKVHDLPIPIISSKPVFYPMADLRYVADGIKPSPYWP